MREGLQAAAAAGTPGVMPAEYRPDDAMADAFVRSAEA